MFSSRHQKKTYQIPIPLIPGTTANKFINPIHYINSITFIFSYATRKYKYLFLYLRNTRSSLSFILLYL